MFRKREVMRTSFCVESFETGSHVVRLGPLPRSRSLLTAMESHDTLTND